MGTSFRDFPGSSAPDVSPSGKGRIYFDSGTGKFMFSENGGSFAPVPFNSDTPTILTGTTPGSGTNESVELLVGGTDFFTLTPNTAYTIQLVVTVAAVISGTPHTRSFMQDFDVRVAAGGSVNLVASGTQVPLGAAPTAAFTLVVSQGSGPDRLVVTFSTGVATTAACSVRAKATLLAQGF